MQTINNTFSKTVTELHGGNSLHELSAHLQSIIGAVRKTGKPGTITYKLTVKPAGRGDVRTVEVVDDIIVNLPQPARPSAIFYATEENTLQRNDPEQREMELRTVEPVVETPREVSSEASSA